MTPKEIVEKHIKENEYFLVNFQPKLVMKNTPKMAISLLESVIEMVEKHRKAVLAFPVIDKDDYNAGYHNALIWLSSSLQSELEAIKKLI